MIDWRGAIAAAGGGAAMLHGKQLATVVRALEEFEEVTKDSAARATRALNTQRELERRLTCAQVESAAARAIAAELTRASDASRNERLEALLSAAVYCREATGVAAPLSAAIDALLGVPA